ncbi:hypothetical protein C8R47DRAFT_969635 [Mycena vitilis]|nr:hypothetical protein C8R47DRAFT_969635 [Mycena vitilis]
MQAERVPPLPARIGMACYKCFKEEDVSPSRCSGCHRIAYCSPECQKTDWKSHKPMCKALSAIEKDPAAFAALLSTVANQATTDLGALRTITEEHRSIILKFFVSSSPVNVLERNLVGWESRCIVCTRTDQLIRMEATMNGPATEPFPRLSPCPRCDLSFCCSRAHWEIARPLHDGPCEDGHDGLSHCDINREVRADVKFADVMSGLGDPSKEFTWAPDRTTSAWTTLSGTSWEKEFGDEMRKSIGVPEARPMGPWIRAASENLSMPMTILYALEQLNDNDVWTRKHTLTIHMIGASMKEIQGAMAFEEILHRLPEVKTLKLVLCGPEMPGGRAPQIITMETCPSCTRRGRKRVHEHATDTYHGFVGSKGSKFEAPDLCIAFNSGASEQSSHTWPATFKILVDRKLPSVFTSYNRDEAEGEAVLLRAAGAKLISDLGPAKNPWGSIKVIPEPNQVFGFYAVNGWIAGAFR